MSEVSGERENRQQIKTRTDLEQEREEHPLKMKAAWAKKLAKRSHKKE